MAPIPVALVDHDCGMDKALLADVAEMLTVVSQRDFGKAPPYGYGMGAVCRVAQSLSDIAPGEWVMGFWSHPDVPGALGYHDVAPNEMPIMHIFPFLDDPANRGITESHELFEAISDPTCQRATIGNDGVIRCEEAGDPVEATSFDYTCQSGRVIRCSNWVTPAYFAPSPDGSVPMDHLGLVTYPGEILDGGYQIVWTPGEGWTQQTAGEKRAYRKALAAAGFDRRSKRVRLGRTPDHEGKSMLDSMADVVTKAMK
jgi:hypothetical protein